VILNNDGITLKQEYEFRCIEWKNIEKVFYKNKTRNSFVDHFLLLTTKSGEHYKINGFLSAFEKVKKRVFLEIGIQLTTSTIEGIEKGNIIQYKSKTAKWDELLSINIDSESSVFILQKINKSFVPIIKLNRWAIIPYTETWEIPNFELMIALIDYYIKKHSSKKEFMNQKQ
jgi:hypothetical protein